MKPRLPRLHAVTNDRVLALPDLLDRAEALAQGADVALHLRGTVHGDLLLQLADAFRDLTARRGSLFIVNDRLDIARLAGADGVHLPETGLPVAAARGLLPPHALVGRSTHSPDAARDALVEADYVFLGPIWPTASHPDRPALGTDVLTDLPDTVVAIGGVTPERVADIRAAGGRAVAAISAVWEAPDPAAAVERFLLSFEK